MAICRMSRPGQLYGYRVHGPYAPRERAQVQSAQAADRSLRQGAIRIDSAGTTRTSATGSARPDADLTFDDRDSAPVMPKVRRRRDERALAPFLSLGRERRPRTAWADTVIYEAHVKGFTARHPRVPGQLRGTFAGLAYPSAIEHLVKLGVTAVELLPVQAFARRPLLGRARASRTTGATTRSASSRRRTATSRAARTCPSSAAWCTVSTRPASR